MTEHRERGLQIVIASGPEALPRAVLGFALAVSAAASGIEVTIILTLSGIAWLTPGATAAGQTVNGFDSISAYMATLRDQGVVLRLCSACMADGCSSGRSPIEPLSGSSYVGLTEVAIRAVGASTQTVVF